MYAPGYSKEQDLLRIIALMQEYPFATLIAQGSGKPEISHLPLTLKIAPEPKNAEDILIYGHMARANPQWKLFEQGEVTAIFHGPYGYITPQWYSDPLNVPTWNYAVVHATGRARVIEGLEGSDQVLREAVEEFERHEPKPWKYELPEEFRDGLVRAIVAFEIRVTGIEGKFKLSQNRDPADREGVLRGLERRGGEMSRGLLKLMRF